MTEKIGIALVTWNGERYIPHLFAALRGQTFVDWHITIVDNNSTDATVEAVRRECQQGVKSWRIICNDSNTGFAAGYNQAISTLATPYIMVLNQDVFLHPECLENLLACLSRRPCAGAVGPLLFRWEFKKIANGRLYDSLSALVDSAGLRVLKNRRVIEDGQGACRNTDKITVARQVFGISAAIALFRREALAAVAEGSGVFDEFLYAYKEDVDLAFRLGLSGWECYLEPAAQAWHDRTGRGPASLDDYAAAKNKAAQPGYVRYHSYKNHLAILYKNEQWQNFILDFPRIFWYEIKKMAYFLVFDRSVLGGLAELWKNRQYLAKKRAQIQSARRVSWRRLRTFLK